MSGQRVTGFKDVMNSRRILSFWHKSTLEIRLRREILNPIYSLKEPETSGPRLSVRFRSGQARLFPQPTAMKWPVVAVNKHQVVEVC